MATKASKANASGSGTLVSIGSLTLTSTGSDTYVTIGEVTDVKLSGRKRATTPSTSFDSDGVVRKLDTIVDYGTITLTVNYVSNDAGQLAVLSANANGGAWDFEIQKPVNAKIGQTTTGDLIKFSAIVTDVNMDIALEKADTFDVTLDIDGAYVITAGA